MNEQERYLFDLQGYVIVRSALSQEQVKEANAKVDEMTGRGSYNRDVMSRQAQSRRGYFGAAPPDTPSFIGGFWLPGSSLLSWGGVFHDILDASTLQPYLTELLGTSYRLDHDYLAMLDPDNPSTLGLHGGGHGAGGESTVGDTDGGQCYYHQKEGRFFSGLVGVCIELNTVGPGDGGFGCVCAPSPSASDLRLPARI